MWGAMWIFMFFCAIVHCYKKGYQMIDILFCHYMAEVLWKFS